MNVTYWTGFSKRKNSTKKPASTGTDAVCALKDDTSILFPDIDSASIPANANYMYISDFGRYYYVRDVTKVGAGRNVFHLEVDPMGSYKSNIGSTSALIEFCADSTNIYLTDPRNKPQEILWEKKTKMLDLESPGNLFNTTGKYVVGITGGPGGVTHYIMDATNLGNLFAAVFDPNFWNQITTYYYDVKDCIVSCDWVPYSPPDTGSVVTSINIGGYSVTGVSARVVAVRTFNIADASYNIAFPSDDLTLGTNYLDLEPFTVGSIYLPFVGVVPMDLGIVANSKQIRIQFSVDCYTQDVIYKLSNDSGDYMGTYQGNCAVRIPIVSQTYNAMGAAAGAITLIGGAAAAVAGALTGGIGAAGAIGAATAAGAGAVGLAQNLSMHTQVNGSISSALSAQMGLACYATVITRQPTYTNLTSPAASSGMPYYEVDTISNHSGYVQCYNASVAMGGFPEEKDTVNGYVNGGFYYE